MDENPTSCLVWQEHKWKPEICVNCKRLKTEHYFPPGHENGKRKTNSFRNTVGDPDTKSSSTQTSSNQRTSHMQIRLTPKELMEIQTVFSDLDWNKDGTIDRREFFSFFHRYMFEIPSEVLEELFSLMNLSNSGLLSFGEFRLSFRFGKKNIWSSNNTSQPNKLGTSLWILNRH
eukprot:TRINITY_DN5272_c0_g1_i1.p1 TRINITY_DN5272_c0_g1~~TRINITY_DN5272_c0_g1_i1.p1  ORF type:complete len:174 (-),score=25.49 TRINITY_DN5272_c0_g1_i1:923-1444(-)